MKREAVIAGLASEGLALILDSAEVGRSAVVGPIPTDPDEFVYAFFIWNHSFVLTLVIFKVPNYMLVRTLTKRVV